MSSEPSDQTSRPISRWSVICLSAILSAAAANPAQADVLTVTADRDNTLYEDAQGDVSNALGVDIFAGRTDVGILRRAVVRFNLGAIPAGSTVTGVTVQLRLNRAKTGTFNVFLHRALADWGEGTSSDGQSTGQGTVATTNDATWLHRFYPTVFWTTPGGDFTATPSATTAVGSQNGFFQWSSAALVADVQGWIDTPGTNYGWVVRGVETQNTTARRFDSREATNAANRPMITVTFTPPLLPTGACCFANGTCQILTQTNCQAQGGAYQGDSTTCTPNPCPQPTGACCLPGEVCTITTAADCTTQGGAYQGDNTSCTPNPCLTGACCFANGSCQSLTAAQCLAQGGAFQGAGVSCTPNPCSAAVEVTLTSVRDNTLYESATGALSNGAGTGFFTGTTNNPIQLRRGVVRFDLSGIPSNATIASARLRLNLSFTQATAADDVTVHRALADWGEGASVASGNQTAGAASTTNDATWIHRFFNAQLWAAAGGDFTASASATTSVGTTTGFYEWTGAGLAADVQQWVSGANPNYGWLLRCNEPVARTQRRFDTRENATLANRPMLIVNYTTGAAFGACCFTNGTCQLLTAADCANQGGVYQGDGVGCVPNPCPPPTGACCFANGSCQVLTATDCSTNGGTYQGDATTCTPNPCPQPPTGACCLYAGVCNIVTQADCNSNGGTYQGDNTACTVDTCPVTLTPYLDPLPIPAVATPTIGTPGGAATYDIHIRQFQQQLHQDLPPTTCWGYNGTYPGPTILATRDQPVTVNWHNDLRDANSNYLTTHHLAVDLCPHGATNEPRVVVHLHGGHVPQASDGYPEDTFLPGQSATYLYPNNQEAATLWFHDHALGLTRLNVMMGLAGYYLLTDSVEAGLALPSGAYETGLAIQDRAFRADGSWKYPASWSDHFFGDTMLVNGKVWPYLNVDRGKYRFRLLNGCNSRTLRLTLSGGATFTQIGAEGGLLPAPVNLTEITMGPGERADVIVDFAPFAAGTELFMTNSAPAPFPVGEEMHALPNVMKFVVQNATGFTGPIPPTLRPITPLNPAEAAVSRSFTLRKMSDPCAGSMWMINDLPFDQVTEFPLLGTTEVWSFINRSGVSHPMHLHLVSFQVLDRQAFTVVNDVVTPTGPVMPPAVNESGWKDTVMAHPAEITRVIAKFENYTGLYPYHCHIIEHEDHEMMRQFEARCVKGDTNQDTQVDGRDIEGFTRALVSGALYGSAAYCATDMDGDEALEAGQDTALFVQCLLTGPCP